MEAKMEHIGMKIMVQTSSVKISIFLGYTYELILFWKNIVPACFLHRVPET